MAVILGRGSDTDRVTRATEPPGPVALRRSFRHTVGVFNATEKGGDMPLQVTAIMIGVQDLDRSKKFYGEGLGCTIEQDHPNFVSFNLGEGSSSLALYQWEAAAQDAGVSSDGSGFRGVSFHFIVPSSDAVDEVMGNAVAAGGGVVKEPAASQWGYFGYFSDPDGHLWKVASGS
jgi:catechol 2,3-dioxygenase-like lactoylglutathione lyase family enzyme